VPAPNLPHDTGGGWAMPTTRIANRRQPLNETRIWDYITFAVLVLLSMLVYSFLVPH
jgi:hypothetical protein